MSRVYSLEAIINMDYSSSNIEKLLQKGYDSLHFQYFKPNFSVFDISEHDIISTKAAVNIILNGAFIDDDLVNFLVVKIDDIYFNLHIIREGGDISSISFGALGDPHLKIFENGIVDLDVTRYIKIMLDFTENYRILNLLVEKN